MILVLVPTLFHVEPDASCSGSRLEANPWGYLNMPLKLVLPSAIALVGLVATSLNHPVLAFVDNAVPQNHAEVRPHQWVETWTSLQGTEVHVKARIVNETGGLLHGSFWPQLTLRFVDSSGKNLAAYQLNLSCPANRKECSAETNLPGGSGLWTSTAIIVASAAEVRPSVPPPLVVPVLPPPQLPAPNHATVQPEVVPPGTVLGVTNQP